jgi:hypothetical protein
MSGSIAISGAQADATASALRERLAVLGATVVVYCAPESAPADARIFALDPNDEPAFAAEKLLDALDALGWVDLQDTSAYTPEEERLMRERLSNLGYIE